MPVAKPADLERINKLQEEHRALDLRLAELQRHISLSPEEQVESAQLKKRKLAMKDELARMGAR